MLGRVDDRVDTRIAEDDRRRVRHDRIAIVVEQTHAVRRETDQERAHHVEQILGDFNLSPELAPFQGVLVLGDGAAFGGGESLRVVVARVGGLGGWRGLAGESEMSKQENEIIC